MQAGVLIAGGLDENPIKNLPICPSFLTLCELAVRQRRSNSRHIQPYAVQTRLGA